jgi:hypothetical protein
VRDVSLWGLRGHGSEAKHDRSSVPHWDREAPEMSTASRNSRDRTRSSGTRTSFGSWRRVGFRIPGTQY